MMQTEFSLLGAGFFILLIAILSIIRNSVYVIKQAEVVVIERLGKFHRILYPGLNFVIPFVDSPRSVLWSHLREVERRGTYRIRRVLGRIDLREAVYDFPKQSVITKDNVTTEINAIVYYHVVDPKAAVYEVLDLPEAIERLAQTTLRNLIGSMDLDETLVSRDQINAKLRTTLDEAASKWGVNVTRVELQDVNPPTDIRLAMEKQMRAERNRRAVILEAEGARQSVVLRAEGDKEARIREAQGKAEAKIIMAQGQADARLKFAQAEGKSLEVIRGALSGKDPSDYLVSMEYIKSLPKMMEGKEDKLVVLPYEATGLMGSFAAIKKIFDNKKHSS